MAASDSFCRIWGGERRACGDPKCCLLHGEERRPTISPSALSESALLPSRM